MHRHLVSTCCGKSIVQYDLNTQTAAVGSCCTHVSAHQDHPRYVLAVLHVGSSDREVHVGWMRWGDALVLDVCYTEDKDGCNVKYCQEDCRCPGAFRPIQHNLPKQAVNWKRAPSSTKEGTEGIGSPYLQWGALKDYKIQSRKGL